MDIHTKYPFKLRGGNNNTKREKRNRILNRNCNNEKFIIASGIGLDLMGIVSEVLVGHDFRKIRFLNVLEILLIHIKLKMHLESFFHSIIWSKTKHI